MPSFYCIKYNKNFMPKPYSDDIRKRVAKYLSKKSYNDIAKRLDIFLSSIKRLQRFIKQVNL